MPRVSAIIPAYNAERFLQPALDSILAQTYQDWEAVVMDDGSRDATRAIVERNLERFGGRLRYFYQENRGLPAARNGAIREARGDVLALLDSDDMWLSNRLERTMAVMDAHPEVGLLHANVLRVDKDGKYIERPPRQDPKYASGKIAEWIFLKRANLQCPTVTFRKACIEAVGGFDEKLRATEDRDQWFRIALRYPAWFIDEDLAHYRVHSSSMSRDQMKMFEAQMVFFDKHRGAVRPSVYRHAVAGAWREFGDHHFGYGDVKQAIHWYWGAVKRYPFNARNVYMLLRALGEPVFGGAGHRAAKGV